MMRKILLFLFLVKKGYNGVDTILLHIAFLYAESNSINKPENFSLLTVIEKRKQ